MRVLYRSEELRLFASFRGVGPWCTNFQYPRGHSSNHRVVRDILNDHGIRAYDDVVAYSHTAQDLGTRTALDAVPQVGRAGRIVRAAVPDGHPVTDQTVITDYGSAVNDDAAMMLDAQPAADRGGRADADTANDFDELVEHNVRDRPGRAYYFITDDEARVPEAVHQQRPEAEAQQSFPLRPEIFNDPDHGPLIGSARRHRDSRCVKDTSVASASLFHARSLINSCPPRQQTISRKSIICYHLGRSYQLPAEPYNVKWAVAAPAQSKHSES